METIDELVAFDAVFNEIDTACARSDQGKGGRPQYSTELMVRMPFLQALYSLIDEDCKNRVLDRIWPAS